MADSEEGDLLLHSIKNKGKGGLVIIKLLSEFRK